MKTLAMKNSKLWISIVSILSLATLYSQSALAAATAKPFQLGFQPAVTPVAEEMHKFHDMVLYIITAIVLFVLGLMIYVAVKFNAKANPEPSKTTHHVLLEVIWTLVPVIILIVIAVPSFRLLYFGDRTANPEMTLTVTGKQWYWTYDYPEHGITFDAIMVRDADLKEGQPRLLATDNEVVVPINTNIQLYVKSADVIHAFAMPAFGVKIDAVPGRLNETWFRVEKEGTYYGQCSELCGKDHAYMPIQIKAVSKEEYAKWVEWAKKEYE